VRANPCRPRPKASEAAHLHNALQVFHTERLLQELLNPCFLAPAARSMRVERHTCAKGLQATPVSGLLYCQSDCQSTSAISLRAPKHERQTHSERRSTSPKFHASAAAQAPNFLRVPKHKAAEARVCLVSHTHIPTRSAWRARASRSKGTHTAAVGPDQKALCSSAGRQRTTEGGSLPHTGTSTQCLTHTEPPRAQLQRHRGSVCGGAQGLCLWWPCAGQAP